MDSFIASDQTTACFRDRLRAEDFTKKNGEKECKRV